MAIAKNTINKDEFAVIKTGGKQYRVSVGEVVTIEKMKDEHKTGDSVNFEEVLLVNKGSNVTIGTPLVEGAKVTGEVVSVGRAPKEVVIKYKAKSRYFKKNGHRQPFVKVAIKSIA